jgi:hypothetical protein
MEGREEWKMEDGRWKMERILIMEGTLFHDDVGDARGGRSTSHRSRNSFLYKLRINICNDGTRV